MTEPGKLLDGNLRVHPTLINLGSELLDLFDPVLNCVTFIPQYDSNGVLAPYMLGVTNRAVRKGEQLGYSYGKEFWTNKTHFSTLPRQGQTECQNYYSMLKSEVVKQQVKPAELISPVKVKQVVTRTSPSRLAKAKK